MQKSSENQGQLVRSIGLTSAIVLIISSVIGTGVFKKIAAMSAELQSPVLVLIAWLLAGLISLAGTLSNAEVASMLEIRVENLFIFVKFIIAFLPSFSVGPTLRLFVLLQSLPLPTFLPNH